MQRSVVEQQVVQTASAQFPNPPFVQTAFAQILISFCAARKGCWLTIWLSHRTPAWLQIIVYCNQFADMRPSQFVRCLEICNQFVSCLTFWEKEIVLAHIVQVGAAVTASNSCAKYLGEVGQQSCSVFGACVAFLLKLHNISSDVPIGRFDGIYIADPVLEK